MTGEESPSAGDVLAAALLGDAADHAELAVVIYDDEGRYLAVNRHACELLGYSREELMQHDVADFTDGGIDRSVLLRPERREGVRIVTRKDGTRVPVAFVVASTRVSRLPFYFAVWWELPDGDARAATAT
jgi:PAS domain S-box-containing protein